MKRTRIKLMMGALACAAAATGPAVGQQAVDERVVPGQEPLKPVEAGVADVGPLSESLRAVDVRVELGNPTGFGRVYEVPGRPGQYMRIDGGLWAVFPQSVYVRDRKGNEVPEIPPGTEFYIGGINTIDTGHSHIPKLDENNMPLPGGSGVHVRPKRGIDTRQWTRVATLDDLRPTVGPSMPRPGDYTPQFALPAPGVNVELDAASTPDDLARPLESTGANPQPPRYVTMATSSQYRANRTRQLLARALSNEVASRAEAATKPEHRVDVADETIAEPEPE